MTLFPATAVKRMEKDTWELSYYISWKDTEDTLEYEDAVKYLLIWEK